MGTLLEKARQAADRPLAPVQEMRLSDFAKSGRVVCVWSDVLQERVYFAADNADMSTIPADGVVYWPDELAAIVEDGGALLLLLHEAKKDFDPQGRTQQE